MMRMNGIDWHWNYFALSSSKIIYGSIYIMVMLEIFSEKPPAEMVAILVIILTMLGIALAEAYSDSIGEEVKTQAPLTHSQQWRIIRDCLPITYGVAIPAIMLALSGLGIIGRDAAYEMAQYGLIAVLFIFGFFSRKFSGGSLRRSILVGLTAVAIGLIIIELRVESEAAKSYIHYII